MDWVVVEDRVEPICGIASALFGYGMSDLNPLVMAVNYLCSERTGLKPELPEGWSWGDLPGNPSHVIGVKIAPPIFTEALWIIYVGSTSSFESAKQWLTSSLPRACMTCLDFDLGDRTGERAYSIAQIVTRDSRHLCYSHASQLDRNEGDPTYRLELEHRRFFLGVDTKRLNENAVRVIAHAREFWNRHNSIFTGDDLVDGVVRMYVQANVDQWDGGKAFTHDELDKESKLGVKVAMSYLSGIPLLPFPDDTFKALFQREDLQFMQDHNAAQKGLNAAALKAICSSLGYDKGWAQIEEGAYLIPPYLPGVLFFCQLKLLLQAMSKPKGNAARNSPTVVIDADPSNGTKRVTIAFTGEHVSLRQDNSLITGLGGGDSTKRMTALRACRLDVCDAPWAYEGIASSIAGLVHPAVPTAEIRTEICPWDTSRLVIRWDGCPLGA
jgi:hypothetical protein